MAGDLTIFTGDLDKLKKSWIALRNFSLHMNFLMSLALIGAAIIGQWPEAAMVLFLFALAEMIEARYPLIAHAMRSRD